MISTAVRFALSVLIAVTAFAATPIQAAELASARLWGSGEVRFSDLRPFGKWTRALDRLARERQAAAADRCDGESGLGCTYQRWERFLDSLRSADRREQLAAVNRYVNARPYVADEANWQQSDYWATPGEFFTRAGDCEDYAIAKYISLRQLGWRDQDLRIVAVTDLRKQQGHAVVVAVAGGQAWVLDNQLAEPTAVDAIRHYRPVFSINTSAWWLHRPAPNA